MIRDRHISDVVATATLSAIVVLACLAASLAINEGDWAALPVVFMFGLPFAVSVHDRVTARGKSDVVASILARYSVPAVVTVVVFITTDGAVAAAIAGLLPAVVLTPMIVRGLRASDPVTGERES